MALISKRYQYISLGILDMSMEMQDGTKVNIEMQVRQQEHWVRRQLFYLAKMYTEDLREGQDYDRLRKCISISILDFHLTEDEEYHSVYRLRDKRGRELSDLLEVHILELTKKLQGTSGINDWIRLFNANSEEDLEMIKTRNTGIAEAMEILKNMSLRKTLRYLHEERLKAIRDRKAEDDFVKDQGRTEGKAEGITEGMAEAILDLLKDVGTVPAKLQEQIYQQKNMEILRNWHKLAARVKTTEEFETHSHVLISSAHEE